MGLIDEGTLRERFPEIPWDQPVLITVPLDFHNERSIERWVCRQCIALDDGLATLIKGRIGIGFLTRDQALDHIEREHHD